MMGQSFSVLFVTFPIHSQSLLFLPLKRNDSSSSQFSLALQFFLFKSVAGSVLPAALVDKVRSYALAERGQTGYPGLDN